MFQLEGLNQLFSNAPATDRNVLADIYHNRNYDNCLKLPRESLLVADP